MTLFINMRRAAVGGGFPADAYVVEAHAPEALKPLPWQEAHARIRGRRLMIFCHGFNVSLQSAVRSAVLMEAHLKPGADELFMAVLWPGDWRVPIINYSFEYDDAIKAGRLLARFVDEHCREALGVSLGSHSLGGRVVLEALAATGARFEQVCIAAPAVDADCLSKHFAPALSRVNRMAVLSSKRDRTLRWAYPLGDFFSDVFGDTDSPFGGALGLGGPRPMLGPPVHAEPIPKEHGYDHGDYFPGRPIRPGAKPPKWARATSYWGSAMRGAAQLKW